MKYVFIDTNLFYEVVTSDVNGDVLDSILKQLNTNRKIKLIFPEVIKVEILSQYTYWKDGVLDQIKKNLDTKKILGISENTSQNNNQPKKQKGETEAEKINGVLEQGRQQIITSITTHYDSMSEKIKQILEHKNTKIVTLTDEILISGMKRSALKKAPFTRAEKNTESAHIKDLDCIAFEALIAFCKKQNIKNTLIMCVADQDYFSCDGKDLHNDIKSDIKLKVNFYKTVTELLNKEFGIQINHSKISETATGSLASGNELLAESLVKPIIR